LRWGLRGQGIEPHGERVELRLPVAAVTVKPPRGLEDRAGVEAAAADPASTLLGHEPGAHQHMDVARHRLQRDVERRRELGDEQVLTIEPREDRPPDRVGQRSEHQVEGLVVGLCVFHARVLLNLSDDNQSNS